MFQRQVHGATVFAAGLCLILFDLQAFAGQRWFTARTVNGKTVPLSVGVAKGAPEVGADGVTTKGAAAPDNGLIDIVISLWNSPDGDNDGNKQEDPGSPQDNIERIVQHFADAVYEMTEGAHRLRNVRIYPNAARSDSDVVWVERQHPHVPAGGGVLMPGGHIVTCDWFTNGTNLGGGNYQDKNMLADEDGAGYTLAHEWGHYFYGVYDEYTGARERLGKPPGIPVDRSIMNDSWNARGGNYDWLNLSVRWRGGSRTNGFGPWEDTLENVQHDVFGESAWETITRPPSWMESSRWFFRWPKWLGGPELSIGARVHYPELRNLAPQGTDNPVNQLPAGRPAAREHLNIIWMGTNAVIQIVIDRSGSMHNENKMQKAKEAAKNLVDAADLGTALGVIDFDDVVTTLYPITRITNAANRTAIKNAIDTLYARDRTAIGDAARLALNALVAYGITNATAAVFLLTDGDSNTGSDPLSIIPDYQASQVPIMGFGYGSIVDPRLQEMANQTGGKYYASPTTLADVQRAFSDAIALVQARAQVSSGQIASSSAATPVDEPLVVDATMTQLRLTVTYSTGSGGTSLSLVDPNGNDMPPTSAQQVGQETLLTFSVDNPVVGMWHLQGTLASNARLVYQADSRVSGFSFTLDAVPAEGDTISSGQPIRIVASLRQLAAIDQAEVTAVVTDPGGYASMLVLTNSASGMYFGEYTATAAEGQYQVAVYARNAGGAALYSYRDALFTPPEGGGDVVVPPDVPVGTDFSRVASFGVQVKGGGGPVIQDVTSDVTTTFNSWTLDRASGALIADITLRNDSGKGGLPLETAFWYAIRETTTVRLAEVSGHTNGMAFYDVTAQIEAQLPSVGNGDLRLDAGESVTFTVPIYSSDRSIPAGHVYSIWADPRQVTVVCPPRLTVSRSADGALILKWPLSSTEFIVEEADAIVQQNWRVLSVSPVVQSQQNTITVPIGRDSKFYRLRIK